MNAGSGQSDDVWGIEVTGESLSLLDARTAQRAREAGVNTLLLGTRLTSKQIARATRIANRYGFSIGRVRDADKHQDVRCSVHTRAWCVPTSESRTRIAGLIANESIGSVGLRVPKAVDVQSTSAMTPEGSRVIAVVALRGKPRRAVWAPLIDKTRKDPSLHLAVSPAGPSRQRALTSFLGYLKSSDVSSPQVPRRLAFMGATPTSLRLSWQASHDNVGVAGYGVYRGDTRVADVTDTTAELTDLSCGTTYAIGVDAIDAAGNRSKRGTLQAATSPCPEPKADGPVAEAAPAAGADTSPPTKPGAISTSGATQTSLIVLWAASTDDVGVSGYGVSVNGAPVGETPSRSMTLTGLNCGTSYTISVDAYDAAGNRSAPATTTASTSACAVVDTTAPTAPTGLTRTGNTTTTISVSWTAATDNVAVSGYRVYRNGVVQGTTAGTSFTVSGLACGTSYIIGVAAYDAAGNQSPSATQITSTAACPPPDTTAPSQPAGLAVSATTATTVSLSWNASTDNVAVTGYGVSNGAASVGTTPSTSYTVAGLTCGTDYTLSVDAFDAAGNRSAPASIAATTAACPVPDTTPPTAPPNLAKVGSTATTITVSWNAASDNIGVVGYSTYRGGTLVSTTPGMSWMFTGLACETTYTLEVEAYDAANNRSPRSSLTATTNACPDTTPPAAPSGLTRSSATETSITLSWNASTDNVGVTGYSTFRNGAAAGNTSTTSYSFSGLTCGTTYTLGVEAADAAGNVSTRSTLNAATAACADTAAPSAPSSLSRSAFTGTTITLSWSASTDNVGLGGYTAYRGTTSQGDTTSTSFTFAGLACGTTYTLGVEAFDTSGNRSTRPTLSAATAACPDTTAPSTPTSLTKGATTGTSIALSWTASTDAVGVTGYSRYVNGTLDSSGAGTSFTFAGLACGTTYTLGVEAYDAAGNRSSRATLSAATSACPDTAPPSAPSALTRTAATTTSITLGWTAATDNVAVTGYTPFNGSTAQSNTTSTSFTFTGLACGTPYTLGVEAFDAAGNRSTRPTLSAATAACPDTTAPSAPGALSRSAFTTTSITLSWTASTDNVGVTGYTPFNGSTGQPNTTSTSFTFTGLICGTTYTLGVESFDAAGNRSTRPTLSAATAACADTSAPSVPTALLGSSATQTAITLSWTPSTDNVGVTGYSTFRDGTSVSTAPASPYTFTGLVCGTTYVLGVEAFDAAGNRSTRATLSAATAACPDTAGPSAPTALTKGATTTTSIALSWTAATDNVGVSGYGRYVNGSLLSNAAGTSFTFTGLSCGTTYTLGVDAYDAAGNRSARTTTSAATSACPDTTAPSAPTGLTKTAGTTTSITLGWTASTDNVAVTGYTPYNGSTAQPNTTSTSFTYTGLTCGTTYTLGVEAFDAAGNRSTRPTLSAATAACPDTTAPSTPTGLTKGATTATSVTVSWNASTDNVGVTGYGYYRSGTAVGNGTGTSYTFTGLTCNSTYTLAVDAYDAAGNRSSLATLSATTAACPDTTAPSAPTALTRSAFTATSVTLSWTAATDNVGVTGYTPYNGSTGQPNTTSTSFTFSGLACGTTYTLGVEAFDAVGNRSTRPTLNAATAACPDTTAPSAPAGLTRGATTRTSIALSWTASTDNVAVTGYTPYNGSTGQPNTTSTSFTFTGLACGTTYTLGVEAFDAAGNRSTRATLSAATSACGDTTAPSAPAGLAQSAVTATSITLSWNPSTDNVGVSGYGRYLNGTLLSSAAGTSFVFTGLACGTTYTLGVDAYDAAGNRSTRSTFNASTALCADSTPPSVPQGLHTAAATQTSITLAWNASTDNIGVVGYHMYRDNIPVSNTPSLTYTFTGLTCGTLYNLALEAYDAAGNVSYRPQAVAVVTTNACSADTQAPTTPTGLATNGITSSSVTVTWNAATDNVGVTGYGYYSNGSQVGNGTGTSYTFNSLTCNTAYTFAVDAYDAAGNRSTRASVNATTSACAPPPPPPPPGSSTANLWVDTNGGSCTRLASAGAYSDAQACGSFAAAYGAASSGDTVRVRAGTYPAQFFAGGVGASQGEGTKALTFIGESGNIVRQIHFGSNNLTFDGIHIDAGGTQTSGAAFENGDSSFLFKNGSIGNVSDEKGAMISGANMVFDNVLFHDVVLRTSGVHLECIMALWNQGMVIRNSTFRNCGIMDASIGIRDWEPSTPPYTNVTLENNYFGNSRFDGGGCCATYSLALWATKIPAGTDYGLLTNWRIVRNHFEAGSGVIVRPGYGSGNVICGNTGSVPTSSWATACP